MAVGTQWNPKEETVRKMLALIDNIGQGIKELKELRQIMSPNQQIQGNQSSNSTGIPPPSVLGTDPAERAREFATTGAIPSPMPIVSADFGVPLGDQENTEQLTGLEKDSDISKMVGEMPNKKTAILLQQFMDPQPSMEESQDQLSDQADEIDFPRNGIVNLAQELSTHNAPVQKIEDGQKNKDAHKMFDKMPNKKIGARLNLEVQPKSGAILGRQEWNWEIPGMPPPQNRKSDQKNSSWRSDFKGGTESFSELEFPIFSYKYLQYRIRWDPGVDFGLMADMNELELKLVEMSIDCNKIEMGLPSILRKFLAITPAHDMFDEMPVRGFRENDSNTQLNRAHFVMGNKVFDPGGLLDQGWALLNSSYAAVLVHRCLVLDSFVVFDPGGVLGLLITGSALDPRVCTTTVESDIANQRLQWDPGGSGCYYSSSKTKLVLLENSLLV